MKKVIEFEIHEYMDLYPQSHFLAMEESEVQDYVNHMNKCYSGGTTRFVKVLTKEEATHHIFNTVKDIVNNPVVTTSDGSLDSVDVEDIKKILKNFEECYK